VAESLSTPAGEPVPVDPVFASAMAAPEPGEAPDYPAPRRRDPDAPHGHDDAGKPLAPYGYTETGPNKGRPRVVPPGPGRGHSSPNDQARVQKAGKGAATPTRKGAAKAEPAVTDAGVTERRAADAETTLELLSGFGTIFAMLSGSRANAAYAKAEAAGNKPGMAKAAAVFARAETMQLDAAALSIHAEGCGAGLAQVAAQNAMAAALVDRLSLINGVASVGMAVLPLVYQIVANHAPKEAREAMPPQLLSLGVLPPALLLEKLQAQNAVKIARAQAEILAERNLAEAQLAELRESAAA